MTAVITHQKYREFDQFCRDRDGNYYGYGEAFTTDPNDSTDCSGLVFQSAAFLMGWNWSGNRFGSTESFRLDYKIVHDLGFRRGTNPGFAPIMRVGLQHGGGGVYSHTACTVYGTDVPGGPVLQSARGVDWESQGNGVFYYEGARAWNDPLFHDFWYLDARLGVAAPVGPPIIEIDEELKRAKAWIGKRIDIAEKPAPDGEGKYIKCEGGHIYWHPKVNQDAPLGARAIAIPNEIFEVYARQGFEKGPLGYPTRRHFVDNGVGTIQGFQGGAIYRKYGTKGGVLVGDIGARYAKQKAEKGPKGYPLGDELFFPGGRYQEFEKGVSYWSPDKVVDLLNDPEAPKQ